MLDQLEQFDANASPFTRALASGHYSRKGHTLTGYYLPAGPGGIVEFIRTCCRGDR